MLYPQENATREVKDLGGLWAFAPDPDGAGEARGWHARPLEAATEMPVPASYNDVTQSARLRDHIGDVWYQRNVYVPPAWRDRRVVLRFDSATHHAAVWVNGKPAVEHKGGYLPFAADVTDLVRTDGPNLVSVRVGNVLDFTTIPPGRVVDYADDIHPTGHHVQEYWHDFFNYAGLHRPVRLLALPRVHITDITVTTDLDGRDGLVRYRVETEGDAGRVAVRLSDAARQAAAEAEGAEGELRVPNVRPWAPGDAYLYRLEVRLLDRGGAPVDCYALPVGIRTVEVTGDAFLINGRPFYFRGLCKHEDADLRGKGYDPVVLVKDFNLLEWIGANSTRTSHYPYAEEFLQLADRRGIAVIDESPAVGLWFKDTWDEIFREDRVDAAALEHHVQVMRDLVARDKNHPSVVMWSVANEAATWEAGARPYFERVAAATREADPTRPVTIVQCAWPHNDTVGDLFDVTCVNRYYGWYTDQGQLDVIELQLENELRQWRERYGRPVLLSEYGADTIEGLHADPPVMFSEEFQAAFLERYHRVLDRLDFVIGEHVWNFADFATQQETRRVGGNRKGVFTRQRQPKAAAHQLRRRWRAAAEREAGD